MNPTTVFGNCTTGVFKLSSGAMMQYILLRHYFLPLVFLFLIGLSLIIFGFVAELRLAVIGLMILCIVIPGLIAYSFFNHGLKEVNALNSIPHTLCFKADGIEYESYASMPVEKELDYAESAEGRFQKSTEEAHRQQREEDTEQKKNMFRKVRHIYPASVLRNAEAFGGGLFLRVETGDKSRDGYLYLPYSESTGNKEYAANLQLLV